MTKNQLIAFIENNYTDDENLMWQIVAKNDIQGYTPDFKITDDLWDNYVRYNESYSVLADAFTDAAVAGVQDFAQENK